MTTSSKGLSRRALLGAFAATTVAAAPTFSNAAGFLRGAGDIRRIRMYSGRTGEMIDSIYWIEPEAATAWVPPPGRCVWTYDYTAALARCKVAPPQYFVPYT